MRVTDLYRIAGPVPFVDVHVDHDNLLFLDPSAIRNATNPLGLRANGQLVSYFTEVLRCRASANPADHAKGRGLLQELHEPNETRLGMSARRVAGHGFGDELGERMWDELAHNAACRAAALTRLEDLRLFVDGVGNDLVSDLTTRVVFDVLAEFTQQMAVRYPTLGGHVSTEIVTTWDGVALRWTPTSTTLPLAAGRQLLLVPKGWVYWRTLMDPIIFYNRFGTETVQQERTTYDREGNRNGPSKAALKAEFRHVRGLNNQQAALYRQRDRDLVAEYRQQVDETFTPLDDDELRRRAA